MDRIKKVVLNGIFLSLLFAGTAFSQTVKIGYVDLKAVFEKYKKTAVEENKFKEEVDKKEAELKALEVEMNSKKTEYDNKKDVMKPEERSKKETELKEKFEQYTKKYAEIGKELESKRKDLEAGLLEEIRKEIKAYGDKNSFTVILDSRMVIGGKSAADITEEIVKILNK